MRFLIALLLFAVPAAAQNFGVTEQSEEFLPDFSAPVLDEDGNVIIDGGIVVEELEPMRVEELVATRPRQAPIVRVTQAERGILRGLDKVSGEVVDFDMAVGEATELGRLTIELLECRQPADNPAGDAFAYVIVLAEGLEDPAFEGWMIASSPALSALDHPRYDVWVIRCSNT